MAEKSFKLGVRELSVFADEMSMMLYSGVSSMEAITLLKEEATRPDEVKFLQIIYDEIVETNSLSMACEKTGAFPEYFTYMLDLGEKTGQSDEVLKSLSGHYRREYEIYQAIRSAISYPLLMITMMLAIIMVLVTQIMPIFARVFEQLGSGMDGISGGLLSVGRFISNNAIVFIVIILAIVVAAALLVYTEKGRQMLKSAAYHFRSFRKIIDKIAISRFASAMSMTLKSGMDMIQAVDVAAGLVDGRNGMDEKIKKCKDELAESMDIGKAFSVAGIFGGLYGRMAVLAAKTGNLENVMEKIAITYQEEADDNIHSIISIVEPTLVIALSVIVGLILLSVMLPLLSIMAGMR